MAARGRRSPAVLALGGPPLGSALVSGEEASCLAGGPGAPLGLGGLVGHDLMMCP